MALILRQFKEENGSPNVPALCSIPIAERIPELAKQDFERVNIVIIATLAMAFQSMNLKRGMNEIQVLELSEEIIDSAKEDNLAIEDVVLFLQAMVRGKYEMSYESMDIPKFMKMFDIYRQQRIDKLEEFRYNKHLELTGLGPAREKRKEDGLVEQLGKVMGRMVEFKNEISQLRKDAKKKNQMDNF